MLRGATAAIAATLAAVLLAASIAAGADVGNRLAYLDAPCDPYYPGLQTPKLTTPQWIGEPGVEAVIVLAIDDLRDSKVHETYLRPILDRLKKIDGRAPVSLMACKADPADPQLAAWLKEGASIEAHTVDHPCPCLQGGELAKAKDTYDRAVDMLSAVPGSRACGFRMPCCDSMNSVSPRFFAEIFNRRTPGARFLSVDSSVFLVFSPDDPAVPRSLRQEPDGQGRFRKYLPVDKFMVNYVEDYPYPWVIGRLCWEVPPVMPSDWDAQHRNGKCSPKTVEDFKAAVDVAVLKQGIFSVCFHPHGWIANQQIVEVIDHAVTKHGRKVKFLTFPEVHDRLTRNVLGGVPLRAEDGGDHGVRVLDLNADGYMDAVVGNDKVRQTRVWSPQKMQWIVGDFPVEIVQRDAQGVRHDAGVRFGVLQKGGAASFLAGNEKAAGAWHFDGRQWRPDPAALNVRGVGADGLERTGADLGALATSQNGRDRGARLADLDRDDICELVIGNETQQAVYRWLPSGDGWEKSPFALPAGAAFVDAQGRDAGLRLMDIDEDGHPDAIFSNAERYGLWLFSGMKDGWSRKIVAAQRGDAEAIPMFVRADGSNNGAWFKRGNLWVQNEDTGVKDPAASQVVGRSFKALLESGAAPPEAKK